MIKTKKAKNQEWGSKLTRESKALQNEWKQFWATNESIPSYYKYNLTICDAPKFIWFRNAKVGTRSTLDAFNIAGVELIAEEARKCYYSPQKYKDYFKFAFVRNPWDRLVSGWSDKVVNMNALNFDPQALSEMQQFENFVAYCTGLDLVTCNIHFRHQCRLIDLNEVNYIGRLEHFNEDLTKIFRILQLPEIQIPVMNKSIRDPSYHSYYTDDTRRMVSEMYRKDIQLFGYTF